MRQMPPVDAIMASYCLLWPRTAYYGLVLPIIGLVLPIIGLVLPVMASYCLLWPRTAYYGLVLPVMASRSSCLYRGICLHT